MTRIIQDQPMRFKLLHIFAFLSTLLLGFTAGAQTTYYVLSNTGDREVTVMNGWSTNQNVTYKLSGPGKTLSVDHYKIWSATSDITVYGYESDNGSGTATELQKLSSDTGWKTTIIDISSYPKIRSIKFSGGGTERKYIRNVSVSRATTLSSLTTELDFGTINRTTDPSGTVTRTISVDYNNTYSGAVLSVTSCPDGFSVSDLSGIGDTGSKTITITYNPSSLGTHQGYITFSMGTPDKGNDVTLPISVKGNCTIDYSVRFNGNGSTTGSMSDQNFKYGVAQALSANAFQRSYTLQFDTDGGDAIDNKTLTHTFSGWSKSSSGVVQYNDRQEVSNLTTTSGETVNLYAKWASVPYSLPTPTKDGFTFAGWYDGETNVGMGGETYSPSQDVVTLKAKWVANGRTPQFNLKQGLNNPQDLYVGDHIDGAFTLTNISEELKIQISPAEGVINVSENEGVVSIEAIGAGTATIKFRQPAVGDIFERESVDYVFHVNKKTPVFNWKIDENQTVNTMVSDFIEITGDPSLVSYTSDDASIVSVINGVLYIGNKIGTAKITVKHAGNEVWSDKTETFNITTSANVSSVHIPFTMDNVDKYNALLYASSGDGIAWGNGGLQLGDNRTFDWDNQYSEAVISLNGVPDKLSFNTKTTKWAASDASGVKFNVYESPDGQIWGESLFYNTSPSSNNNISQLLPSSRYLKFTYVGNLYGIFTNITVTELKQYAVDKESIDFGRFKENTDAPQAQSITLTHSNAVNVTRITCSDNDNFGIDKTLITSTGGDKFGEEVINISYKNINVGIHEATITISDGTNTRTVTVKGETYDATLTLDPENPKIAPDTYDAITLKRTLSTGLITIALPFDTTVEALTGNQSDKAYTLCNVGYKQGEGYTFYFKEVEGGALQAGKPYVISIASEVVNPQWGETTIGELTPETVTCGAWSFRANFEAGKSMKNLYGVVNTQSQNKVMKGGENSTLNAFSAYFELSPAAALTAAPASTKAAGSAVAPSAAGSSAAVDLPANAIPLFTVKE